ncbi:hypothetical protein P12x_004729 [Tundrisphaera lichenicola]|uniref:hypothetical protein n=1 Tax=Tundrisphaera lichenicola TaxID=2029860 RepID=UPI003EBC174F
MSSNESHRERRNARRRRRPEKVAVEGLETRQLLTYSAFGYSLPDLTVSGYAARAATWGGQLNINVDVENLGASSLIEPTHLAPGATSTADAPATTVDVFASTQPKGNRGLVKVGTIAVPPVQQNSDYETTATINLPDRPAGFPGDGGVIYLRLVVNNARAINESDTTNNTFRVPTKIRIAEALPNLRVVGFDVPTTLVPGQVISPTIRVANYGPGNPSLQGPVTVQLVASLNNTFGPGDVVVGSYVINSLPGISAVPTKGSIRNNANVIPTANEITTTLPPLTLPTTPDKYFLGIIIDPNGDIKQTRAPSSKLQAPVKVGPNDGSLPSGGLLVTTNGQVPVFPAPPSTILNPVTGTTIVPPIVNVGNLSSVAFANAAKKKAARKG